MRRIATALGTLAAAALLGLAVPGSAYAADGFLFVDGYPYFHPSGCYPTGDDSPTTVVNRTHDAIAYIFTGPDCTGDVDTVVQPGRLAESDSGASVWID
ncbi:hypothetical protein [Streptomyces chattanoogensis]|uniref:hypothetical protein n=1 Tax=Streptomyces chattanoogensis TaxID=66876 RepID=UPI0036A7C85C